MTSMRTIGALVGSLLMAMVASCSLLDPLDDVSGGTRDAGSEGGAPSSSEGGASKDASADAQAGSACTKTESEPTNDSASTPDILEDGTFCAQIGPGDTDKLAFDVTAGSSATLIFSVDTDDFAWQAGGVVADQGINASQRRLTIDHATASGRETISIISGTMQSYKVTLTRF